MILAMLAAAAAAAAGPVTITAHPASPYAEIDGQGVQIDGDFLIENKGDEPLGIDELAVEVRDPSGRLVQRREWNGNGVSPSIKMLNATEVPAHGRVLLFNPISRFPADVAVGTLKAVVALSRKGIDERIEATTTLTPKRDGQTLFAFPLKGRVLVWDGHDFASHHRRWDTEHPVLKGAGFTTTAARYSLDLILIDADGRRSTGDEKVNANWTSFGAPVLSEGAGRVVSVRSDLPDDRTFDVATVKVPNAMYGNHVVIAHEDGSYSMYGHLKQGSVKVKPGDMIAVRQQIGLIGASGSANFPHLHVERMDGPTDRSEGIPTRFSGVKRPGGVGLAAGFVDSGDVVIAD